MPPATVTLESADGARTPATADVARYGPNGRLARCVLWMAGGLLLGAACILVPLLHFITTWALPLVGILLGMRALRTHATVFEIAGKCPHCGEAIELHGGRAGEEPMEAICPKCEAELRVFVEEI